MTEKTYIKTVWVIAQSEGMAWQLLKHSQDHAYTDINKARADFQAVQKKTFFDCMDGFSKGKPWHLYTMTFAVTFTREEG